MKLFGGIRVAGAVLAAGALSLAGTGATGPSAAAATHRGVISVASGHSALDATNTSNNWSGYNQGTLEKGGTLFQSISAQWVVPTATQHTKGQAESSSTWIGIGGGCVDAGCTVTDGTLIQAGTEQDIAADGSATYSAWWETVPVPSLTVTSVAVHPGDTVSVAISQTAPEVWSIALKDLTDGQGFTQTIPYSSTYLTAEWIEETPLVLGGSNTGLAALPNLTPVTFDLATVNGAPANLSPAERINLVDTNGAVIASASTPDPDVDGFNDCTWSGSCSAPTSS
ncbi:MAG TPA: G1 family glutamic endopeptidase [Acidimicrobiales bacterium]|nr:G1 family glutamic endopeptidase [Acidimicrobiales bacterium]